MLRSKDAGDLSLAVKNSGIEIETKALKDDGSFEGYGSVFGVVDSYGEVVEPGAFIGSLAKRKARGIKMLWQHDMTQPIGIYEDVAEDAKGLWVKGRLLKDVSPRAAEAYGLLKAGALDGLSIGYRVLKSEPHKDRPQILRLTELDLREVSVVTFAANERARVESVKSGPMMDFARRLRDGDPPPIKEFEDVLREAGIPKSMATAIASVGYAKAVRRESESEDAGTAFLTALLRKA